MSPEFSTFLTDNGTILVIVLGLLAAVALVQWRKVRLAESEHDYKRALLDKGLTPADIEKTLAATPPARRGLIEQFGTLSGGAKFGLIFASIVLGSVVMGCLSSILHSRTHYSHAYPGTGHSGELVPPAAEFDGLSGDAFFLDLQPAANQRLADAIGDNGQSLAAVPRGRREFGGVPFQVGSGYLRLRGRNRPDLPEEANNVRVGFTFDRLHVLHGTEFGTFGDPAQRLHVPEGTKIGHYRIRYSDGDERTIPVEYGRDVRDVWNRDLSRATPRGKVAWTGRSAGASRESVNLRLYLTTWPNPRPDEEVTHIDFVSACTTAASPFCVALTAERAAK